MVDPDDAKLKAEIDEIVQNIDVTMKKIEQVVPLNPVSSGPAEAPRPSSGPPAPVALLFVWVIRSGPLGPGGDPFSTGSVDDAGHEGSNRRATEEWEKCGF